MSGFLKKVAAGKKASKHPETDETAEEAYLTGSSIKTPRAAAIAGIIFSGLIITSTILIRLSLPGGPGEAGRWLTDDGLKGTVIFALNLVPFAGIAFLWFIGVIRDRMGKREDLFFATVFLGSGLLYIAMLFASAAIDLGLLSSIGATPDAMLSSGAWEFNRSAASALTTVYAMKMAGVFTISTATLFLHTATAPRWLAFTGYAIAPVLLFVTSFSEWLSLLFPVWVLLASAYILAETFRRQHETRPGMARGSA